MQTLPAQNTRPTLPQPWDFTGIVRFKGKDGLRLRYYTLLPFAELLREFADTALLLPIHWYRSPAICTSLAALQAQWDECNSSAGKAWVAARFWTQDILCLREICKGSGCDTPPDAAHKGETLPTFNEYLDGPEFTAMYDKLRRFVIWQDKAAELSSPAVKGRAA